MLPPSYPLIGASLTQRLLLTLDQTAARLSQTTLPRLTAQAVRAWRDRLLLMTRKEVLALNPRLLAGRDDVFAGAVLILDGVMRHFGYALFECESVGFKARPRAASCARVRNNRLLQGVLEVTLYSCL